MKNKYDLIITGSLGKIGSEISNFFETRGKKVAKLDLNLGHDLSDESFVKEWFSNNYSKSLINCFAINDHINSSSITGNFRDISLAEVTNYFHVNVISLFSVCREYIINQNEGRIVNLSSIYSIVSPRTDIYGYSEKSIAYGMTKAAVNQMSRHLATHSAPNFSVNSLILGGIENNHSLEFVQLYNEQVPMKRMANVNDFVGLIDYLCFGESNYLTGSEIIVDGGWTSW